MEYQDLFRQTQRPKYDCLLFDLDDTLYPLSCGIAKACTQNIKDYMVEKLRIEKSKIDDLSNLLYKNYGTTMAGLRGIGYDFDYDDYHSYVHGRLPYENLKPDPVLRNLLKSLPYRKLIFTNADKVHAVKALSRLGLEDCFEGIICFETLNPINKNTVSDDEDDIEFVGSSKTNPTTANGADRPQIFDIIGHFAEPNPSAVLPKTPIICKPSENAIEFALKIANLNPQRTLKNVANKVLSLVSDYIKMSQLIVAAEHTTLIKHQLNFINCDSQLFFEDSVRNIQAGKRVGLHTVLVGTSQKVKGADYALESIHNLRQAVPELWEADIKSEVAYSGKLAVETSVTA